MRSAWADGRLSSSYTKKNAHESQTAIEPMYLRMVIERHAHVNIQEVLGSIAVCDSWGVGLT